MMAMSVMMGVAVIVRHGGPYSGMNRHCCENRRGCTAFRDVADEPYNCVSRGNSVTFLISVTAICECTSRIALIDSSCSRMKRS